MILFISLSVIFISGASFAVSDDNITVSEINDEIIVEDVLAIDENTDTLNNDENIILEQDSEDVLKESSTVTPETFSDYFNEYGNLKDTVISDELKFEGDFSNIELNTITVDKSIIVKNQNYHKNFSTHFS